MAYQPKLIGILNPVFHETLLMLNTVVNPEKILIDPFKFYSIFIELWEMFCRLYDIN